jgi:hypothetical protein
MMSQGGGSRLGSDGCRTPDFPKRPCQIVPRGSLWKFRLGLGRFPLSFAPDLGGSPLLRPSRRAIIRTEPHSENGRCPR